jgi:hypothetical protein
VRVFVLVVPLLLVPGKVVPNAGSTTGTGTTSSGRSTGTTGRLSSGFLVLLVLRVQVLLLVPELVVDSFYRHVLPVPVLQ